MSTEGINPDAASAIREAEGVLGFSEQTYLAPFTISEVQHFIGILDLSDEIEKRRFSGMEDEARELEQSYQQGLYSRLVEKMSSVDSENPSDVEIELSVKDFLLLRRLNEAEKTPESRNMGLILGMLFIELQRHTLTFDEERIVLEKMKSDVPELDE